MNKTLQVKGSLAVDEKEAADEKETEPTLTIAEVMAKTGAEKVSRRIADPKCVFSAWSLIACGWSKREGEAGRVRQVEAPPRHCGV